MYAAPKTTNTALRFQLNSEKLFFSTAICAIASAADVFAVATMTLKANGARTGKDRIDARRPSGSGGGVCFGLDAAQDQHR